MPGSGPDVQPALVYACRFPARPEQLRTVRERVEQLARSAGFEEPVLGKIILAVDEALTNVIRHGYGGPTDQPIDLQVRQLPSGCPRAGLELEIRDFGRQVDPCVIRSRALEDIRPGGLGVHLIQSIMDSAVWSQAHGGGMRLTLRKYTMEPGPGSGCPEEDV